MGWTYSNTANTPAPAPNYPVAPNSNFSDFYKQTANSFSPANYTKPNSYGMGTDLNDPMGNPTQLAQMIAMIVQQILGNFLQGGPLGNLAGQGQGQGQQGGGFNGGINGVRGGNQQGAGYGGYLPGANDPGYGVGPNGSGYGGYGGPNGSGYGDGGMSNFRWCPPGNDYGYKDTKGWWGRGAKDCDYGEYFRDCKRDRPDPDCDRPDKPPKHKQPPDCENPPPKNPPPKNPPPEKPGKPVHGSITGDPHFLGADGEKYDIKGEHGKTYNLIADKDMSVNARFDKYGDKGATVMDALGFNFGKDKLSLDVKDGKTILRYNGADIDTSKNWNHDGYSWDAAKKQFNVKKTVDKESWDLTTNVKGKGKDSYLDLYINKGSKVDKNDTKTTGLWGDSISGKKEDVNQNGGAGVLTGADGKPLDKKYGPDSAEYKKALASKEVKDLGSKK